MFYPLEIFRGIIKLLQNFLCFIRSMNMMVFIHFMYTCIIMKQSSHFNNFFICTYFSH